MATRKMGNTFEFKWSTKNAFIGAEFMDWLNERDVDFDITLANPSAKKKEFEFYIHANRMNVTEVMRYMEEVL